MGKWIVIYLMIYIRIFVCRNERGDGLSLMYEINDGWLRFGIFLEKI